MTFQPSQEPTGDEAIAYLQRCARSIEAHGWGTEEVAGFLLHAAYNLHAEAQGAPDMIAWRDRANRRFLFSAGFFCIGVARAPMTRRTRGARRTRFSLPPRACATSQTGGLPASSLSRAIPN